jgi:hypothetical protein
MPLFEVMYIPANSVLRVAMLRPRNLGPCLPAGLLAKANKIQQIVQPLEIRLVVPQSGLACGCLTAQLPSAAVTS